MSRASSSRLSEAPQRVTHSNRMSMVDATPQGKQPAFGKLNIPKPQSGTSERTSFFGSRTSGAGMARDSAFGGADKFLIEKGFPGIVSVKSLQGPSTKEFLRIFEFLYCLIDPTFQMPTSKVEEEVPRILKDLGFMSTDNYLSAGRYPFPLSKSSMFSVGAPHTWPQVLGALIWLIDTLKLFHDYSAETYHKFMQGADTFEEEDNEYLANLKKLYSVDKDLLVSMEEKYRMLSDKVARMEKESQMDRLESKRVEKVKLSTDLQKLKSYRNEVETLKQEQSRLQHILSNQKFTSADIERDIWEKRELQKTINSLNKSLELAQQHMWKEEIALTKVKETAEEKLAEYHKLARKLKLIPNPLKKMITDVEEECSRLKNKTFVLEESMEQVNSNISEKANDLKQLRAQIRRVDKQLEHHMQEIDSEEQKWAAEMENVEKHRTLLEKKVTLGYDDAMEELKAAKQQYQIVLQETKEARRTVVNNLAGVFTTAIDHLSIVDK
ncbi:unnamed protein product [Coregonus sp. 'balchen']|nr:unnamed protein product [Coregonus sp. 'balchen']